MIKTLFLLLLLPLQLLAQSPDVSKLTGHVMNRQNEALIGANVALRPLTGTAQQTTITNANGDFLLTAAPGTDLLTISYVGYATYQAQVDAAKDVHIKSIILKDSAANTLKDVEVVGRKLTYNATGYSINIANDEFYKQQSLDETLRMLPGVSSVNNILRVYDNYIARVFIDKRQARLTGQQLLDYLNSFRSSRIKSIRMETSGGADQGAGSTTSSSWKANTSLGRRKYSSPSKSSTLLQGMTSHSKSTLAPYRVALTANYNLTWGKKNTYVKKTNVMGNERL